MSIRHWIVVITLSVVILDVEAVKRGESHFDVAHPLDSSIVYSRNRLRTTSSVMQSFDFDFDRNLIFYTQLNRKYRAYLCWAEPNSEKLKGCMELRYFGHVSNFSVENAADRNFLWVSNYASKREDGNYWDSQIISRIPIVDGKVVNPWDCTDNYYFGEKDLAVAVDFENRRLITFCIGIGKFTVYPLDKLNELPIKEITLSPIVYGGDAADEPESTKTFKVMARDCRMVKPISSFTVSREPGIAFQGFDIFGDTVYQMRGNGNKNDGKVPSTAWLHVFDIKGNTLVYKQPLDAVADMDKLKEAGITDSGYMEPEGVKYRNGILYVGFASKNLDDRRKGNIFKYESIK